MQAFRDLDVCWLVSSSQGQVPGGGIAEVIHGGAREYPLAKPRS
ncbi:unnamed protein product, partial [Staurois parvus]